MPQTALPLPDVQPLYVIDGRLVPSRFPYLDVLLHGRPGHRNDDFSCRHPQMERGKRAKLFAPFDALDGYSENIAGKNVVYVDKVCLDDSEKEELNRRLTILRTLTFNSRLARANRVQVTVCYFVPCTDVNSFSHGLRGQYVTARGIVWRVDMEKKRITVDQTVIPFKDILAIYLR